MGPPLYNFLGLPLISCLWNRCSSCILDNLYINISSLVFLFLLVPQIKLRLFRLILPIQVYLFILAPPIQVFFLLLFICFVCIFFSPCVDMNLVPLCLLVTLVPPLSTGFYSCSFNPLVYLFLLSLCLLASLFTGFFYYLFVSSVV